MDQVEDPEVLYKVFNWISMDNSRLLLVGIANSLDLTDRVLPRFVSNNFFASLKWQVLISFRCKLFHTVTSKAFYAF